MNENHPKTKKQNKSPKIYKKQWFQPPRLCIKSTVEEGFKWTVHFFFLLFQHRINCFGHFFHQRVCNSLVFCGGWCCDTDTDCRISQQVKQECGAGGGGRGGTRFLRVTVEHIHKDTGLSFHGSEGPMYYCCTWDRLENLAITHHMDMGKTGRYGL